MLPIDAGALPFVDDAKARGFWQPIFDQGLDLSLKNAARANSTGQSEDQRAGAAITQVVDQLGDIEGVGTFDFTYPAVALAAMMLLVGPIDWLVLKKLNRQPWTWATTTGWIALITLGAVYIGHMIKSGNLHYRTLGLVDQVDGQTVARTDLAVLYSPRTAQYGIEPPAASWWEPAELASSYSRGGGLFRISTFQDFEGNLPGPLTVNVWNIRALRGQSLATGGPLIRAELRRTGTGQHARLTGTITNLGTAPLTEVKVRLPDCWVDVCGPATATTTMTASRPAQEVNRIEPQATVQVDVPIHVPQTRQAAPTPQIVNSYPRYGAPEQPADGPLIQFAGDVAAQRSIRIEQLLSGHKNLACIYAKADPAEPVVKLSPGHSPVEHHVQIIRALVELQP